MDVTINLKYQYQLRQRYTALWAFSESVLGGILHAFRIPFTGLFLGGFAVIFLSLISDVSHSKKDLLKVTSIVIFIKFILSPNTPFTAYIAVFMQGVFAFLAFSLIRNRSVAIAILSFLTAIWSVSQKIILTTIIFGMTFWYSIDQLAVYVARIVGVNLNQNFSMSLILISAYVILHLMGAFIFARIAINLPDYLKKNKIRLEQTIKNLETFENNNFDTSSSIQNSKKEKWYKKPNRIILFIFLLLIAFITYLNPDWGKIKFVDVVSMLVRAVILIYLWFKVISPNLIKIFIKILRRNSNLEYINDLTVLFPEFKKLILYSWKINSNQPKLIRIKKFFDDALLLLLR